MRIARIPSLWRVHSLSIRAHLSLLIITMSIPLILTLIALVRLKAWEEVGFLGFGLTFVAAGTSFLMGRTLIRAFNRQLNQQMEGFCSTLAAVREGISSARVPEGGLRELNELSEDLNRTLAVSEPLFQSNAERDAIQTSVLQLLYEVSRAADGDLTENAKVAPDLTGAIADSFNDLIESLRTVIGDVQRASHQVAGTAADLYGSTTLLANRAEEQVTRVESTSLAIARMTLNIGEIAQHAKESAQMARLALEGARHGNDAVQDTIRGMDRIREQAHQAAHRIKRLGETSQEIGEAAQLIDEISQRTSLLALNASIQAAAAGPAGRSFAVVAEEVERLAVASAKATRRIEALVRAVQGEANATATAMENAISEVVGGSEQVNRAGEALVKSEEVFHRLADMTAFIFDEATDRSKTSERLAEAVGGLIRLNKSITSGVRLTANSVQELFGLAQGLNASSGRFHLPEDEDALILFPPEHLDELVASAAGETMKL